MKLVLYSPAFLPMVGGLELHVDQLAEGLQKLGHDVVVVTQTPGSDAEPAAPYRVVRQPTRRELLRWVRWCDVFYQANVSLRGLWPLLFVRRPWVVSHHSWYCRTDGRVAFADRLKRYLLRFATGSIAVSQAVADDLGGATVIPNTYRDRVFRLLPDVPRDQDLLFVGRLVSDKGVDILLAAMARLAGDGLRPHLTVAGDGPERATLERQAQQLALDEQVAFVGLRSGDELVELMNRHRILVVPSRYREPFGIVALEGIASGCIVVGSREGGLPGAIGPCGLTFRNGDASDLAQSLALAMSWDERERRRRLAAAGDHLARHSPRVVVAGYLEVLDRAAARRRTSRQTMALVA